MIRLTVTIPVPRLTVTVPVLSSPQVGVSRDPCSDTYAGPRPFSEPETRAVKRFLLSHSNRLEMFLTFHR